MKRVITFFNRPLKDVAWATLPSLFAILISVFVAYKLIDPAPPRHVVISSGTDEGDYQLYASLYQALLEESGVQLDIRPSNGGFENLQRLSDPNSGVDIGFVQEGVGSPEDSPHLLSLGSLYYEPLWIFYRGPKVYTKLNDLKGLRIGVGQSATGTSILSHRLLTAAGVDGHNSQLVSVGWTDAAAKLKDRQLDVAFFIETPEDAVIGDLIHTPGLQLMNFEHAEAIERQFSYLHHLVLPKGTLDLKLNLPPVDTNLISPTATLLVKDTVHPALIYLILKAASQIHNSPGIFEKKKEFPIDKDDVFPLSNEAERFYRSGGRFWQKYLPYWLATLVDRFVLAILPLLVVVFPAVRLIPKLLDWRVRQRIYKRYGDLKFVEADLRHEKDPAKIKGLLSKLDVIEEQVRSMKVPLPFSEHLFFLREHISLVRSRFDDSQRAPAFINQIDS